MNSRKGMSPPFGRNSSGKGDEGTSSGEHSLGFSQMIGRFRQRLLKEARHRMLFRLKMHMKEAFGRGLIGKRAIVVLLNAVDDELTLLKLNKHTARELMPFRHIVKAATPKMGGFRFRLTQFFEELSEILPGSAGKWCERRAHKLAVKNFQGEFSGL